MLFDLLISLLMIVLGLVTWVFTTLSAFADTFLAGFTNSVTFAFSYVNVFGGVLDIPVLMSCVLVIVAVWLARFQLKQFFKFIWPLIPYFGRNKVEPFKQR